jgi:hypothetical protein
MMKQTAYKHYIEILPAAMLPQRRAWQNVAQSLPTGAYLLIANPKHQTQAKIMYKLTRLFRQKGKLVVIWAAEEGRKTPVKPVLPDCGTMDSL